MKSKRVGVVVGGGSVEQQLPFGQMRSMLRALRGAGHEVRLIELRSGLDPRRALEETELDVALVATHFAFDESCLLLQRLEELGIPYTGSSASASTLSMDKLRAKELFVLHNLPTPRAYELPLSVSLDELGARHADFGYPAVVKPRSGSMARGVKRVDTLDELRAAVVAARCLAEFVLVERYVDGQEIMIGFLGGRVLGAIEFVTPSGLLGTAAKISGAEVEVHLPARINAIRTQNLFMLAERAVEALGVTGPAEVDLRVTEEQNEVLLEVNTQPYLTPTSAFVRLADAAGFGFAEVLESILESAQLPTAEGRVRAGSAEVISMIQASQPALVAAAG